MTINVLIWGSNIMFLVGALQSRFGYRLAIIVTVICGFSFIVNIFDVKKFRTISMVSYLVGGWMCFVAIKQLYSAMGVVSVTLLIAGGLVYTFGLTTYAIKKPYLHSIWHVFVFVASLLQFFAAYIYVINY